MTTTQPLPVYARCLPHLEMQAPRYKNLHAHKHPPDAWLVVYHGRLKFSWSLCLLSIQIFATLFRFGAL